jgi:hypothetical protein
VVANKPYSFSSSAGSGSTTGLAVLKAGFVLVGNMPTIDETSATVKRGSLTAVNPQAQVVWTFCEQTGNRRPWDFTVYDQGSNATVFVSNVFGWLD